MVKKAVVTAVKEHAFALMYGKTSPTRDLWLSLLTRWNSWRLA